MGDNTNKAEIVQTPDLKSYEKFDDMNLHPDLLFGIFSYGYKTPSAIQSQAIVPIVSGKDTIAQAQSGTGKTAAFTIGLLQRIDIGMTSPQAIILSPTRELALQTLKVVDGIGSRLKVVVAQCIGGTQVDDDIAAAQSCHMIVATPGRLLSLLQKKHVTTSNVKMVVLDEADEMLSRGFTEQIVSIMKFMNPDIQIVLVSATLPPEILELTRQFMRDPVSILVKEAELTLDGIRQYVVELQDAWKTEVVEDIYKVLSVQQGVIFCNSIGRVKDLAEKLKNAGHTISCIHSELDQAERNKIMGEFRSGQTRILIATNIIARGIDVQNVSLVINYDIPREAETYLHRIGRSGRFGRKGVAINFVTEKDKQNMQAITDKFNVTTENLPEDLSSLF